MGRRNLGGLDAVVTGGADGEGGGDGPVAVLCHGFGAPGDDLVALAPLLRAAPGTRFIFPAAPLAIDGMVDARAWWMIDMERLALGARRAIDPAEVPVGLVEARARLSALLDAVESELGVAGARVALGGFSQGAMLALDVALHRPRPLAGLVLLSGTLIAERVWTPLLAARRGLPVLQSHGDEDPLLPYALAERLRELLASSGLAVEWMPFHGGHEIPLRVLRGAGQFLSRVLG